MGRAHEKAEQMAAAEGLAVAEIQEATTKDVRRVKFGIDCTRRRRPEAMIRRFLASRFGTYLRTRRFVVLPHERHIRRRSDFHAVCLKSESKSRQRSTEGGRAIDEKQCLFDSVFPSEFAEE